MKEIQKISVDEFLIYMTELDAFTKIRVALFILLGLFIYHTILRKNSLWKEPGNKEQLKKYTRYKKYLYLAIPIALIGTIKYLSVYVDFPTYLTYIGKVFSIAPVIAMFWILYPNNKHLSNNNPAEDKPPLYWLAFRYYIVWVVFDRMLNLIINVLTGDESVWLSLLIMMIIGIYYLRELKKYGDTWGLNISDVLFKAKKHILEHVKEKKEYEESFK